MSFTFSPELILSFFWSFVHPWRGGRLTSVAASSPIFRYIAAIRLVEFYIVVNRVADDHGWDVAEIFQNLALQSVIDDQRIDQATLVESAKGSAATLKAQAKKAPAERAAAADRSGKGGGKAKSAYPAKPWTSRGYEPREKPYRPRERSRSPDYRRGRSPARGRIPQRSGRHSRG